jgi:hypothetical protein
VIDPPHPSLIDGWFAAWRAMLRLQGQAWPGSLAPDEAAAADPAGGPRAVVDFWTEAARLFAASAWPAAPSDAAAALVQNMCDPSRWLAGGEMEQVLARMAEGPRLADLWSWERRFARLAAAWLELRRVAMAHGAIVMEGWGEAGRRFAEALVARAGAVDARGALALWTETANRQLLETQRSEPFLTAQRAMIRATTELRLAQQDLVEELVRPYGVPTRTEVDDLHRSVTELRREVRRVASKEGRKNVLF